MVFSSPIFVFLFLPLVFTVYFVAPKNVRNVVLLVVSLLFYAWGEGKYVSVMLLSIGFNHFAALVLTHRKSTRSAKWILTIAVVVNLFLLGILKYASFATYNIGLVTVIPPFALEIISDMRLPIGISFYTFQAMSYVIDVYRRDISAEHNLLNTALYISFFPQLIAGPIVRYSEMAYQLVNRRLTTAEFAYGVRRFIVGISKKVLLANPLAITADQVFSRPLDALSFGIAWLGVICYTLQIYFDFSGYSDMAIGLAHMFGFRFPENFNYPYISQSVREFWRRWHITLSNWFRDYLFIPLGGSRGTTVRTYFNLLIVFALCGLWHGPSWTFVFWGLFHGTFMVLERIALDRWLALAWPLVRHVYTLLVVMVGWVFFRSDSFDQAQVFLSQMFSIRILPFDTAFMALLTPGLIVVVSAATLLSAPVPANWLNSHYFRSTALVADRAVIAGEATSTFLGDLMLSILLVASLMFVAADTYSPFLYFRF